MDTYFEDDNFCVVLNIRVDMNREIKFRGKRKDNGEWVYGHYIADVEWGIHWIYYQKKGPVYFELARVKVDPETVGQFIGLKDKNGNEIYERDFIRVKKYIGGNFVGYTYEDYEIIYSNFSFSGKPIKDRQYKQWTSSLLFNESEEILLIGNATDNPKLLK